MRLRFLLIPVALLGGAAVLWRRRVHGAHLARLATLGKTLTLKDGRALGYAEYGDPDGRPVFFLHGTAGSRLAGRVFHDAAARLGARIIAPERPGYGFSTPKPDRTLLEWADDVAELADALGIARFAVFGVSGGGPHAATCAYRLPERVTAVGLVSSVAPADERPGLHEGIQPIIYFLSQVGRVSPWLAGMFGKVLNWPWLLAAEQIRQRAPELYPRYAQMACEIVDIFIDDTREAFRGGVLGFGTDFVSAKPWGFKLTDITVDPVYLWHGEADTNVPPAMGHYLAETIPHCRATFYPGEDHVIASLTHADEVLSALLSEGQGAT